MLSRAIFLVSLTFVCLILHDTAVGQLRVSHQAGFYAEPFYLELESTIPNTRILYTLDGSEPHLDHIPGVSYSFKSFYPTSPGTALGDTLTQYYKTFEYSEPIAITDRSLHPNRFEHIATSRLSPENYMPANPIPKGTVVKFREVHPDGLHGPVYTKSFFITQNDLFSVNMPIISLSIQENLLFDYYDGIYVPGVVMDSFRLANPSQILGGFTPGNFSRRGEEWEYPAHLEFFESGGRTSESRRLVLNQDIGVRIHGGFSRSYPIKSLRLYARNRYGDPYFRYDVFGNGVSPQYKRLLLRNSGNDYNYTYFRDALIHRLFSELNFETQQYRAALLFINGEFWGIHNIRERLDKHYLSRVHNIDSEQIDLLERNAQVKEGSVDAYEYLMDYVMNHHLSDSMHYAYVTTLMDVDNYIDYQIAQIFVGNTDWPSNNIDYWRWRCNPCDITRDDKRDGRFRWLFYDADFGFGLFGTEPDHNTLFHALQANNRSPSATNPHWSTELFRQLHQSDIFRNQLVSRYLDLRNTILNADFILPLVDDFEEHLQEAMPWHIERWSLPSSESIWRERIHYMRSYIEQRPDYVLAQFSTRYNLSANHYRIQIHRENPDYGTVRVNSIALDESNSFWEGSYPQGHRLTLTAEPAPNYIFSHWIGISDSTQAVITIELDEDHLLEPVFVERMQNLVLHYWHFNNEPALAGMVPADAMHPDVTAAATLEYIGNGTGYMDLTDGTNVNAQVDTPAGDALRVRNPSEQRALQFRIPTEGFESISISFATMRTPNGARQQRMEVSMDAGHSWQYLGEAYTIEEHYMGVSAQLPNVSEQSDIWVRILFLGEEASGTSGNNRFDNIVVAGNKKPVSVPGKQTLPQSIVLMSNYPNPFNASTTIQFMLPYPDVVELSVFDVMGRHVTTLQQGNLAAGRHSVVFNTQDLPSGVYFYTLRIQGESQTKSMLLIK